MVLCKNCFENFDEFLGMCPYCGYSNGDGASASYFLKPGTVLNGRYVVGMAIGYGGFGITYKAYDQNSNTVVAIKEYYYASMANRDNSTNKIYVNSAKNNPEFEHFKARFLDEARYTAKFSNNPNIVNVFDFFEENNTVYIVMEFLDGESLSAKIKREDITVEQGVEIISHILLAVKAVHAQGVVHRDISPDNILMCKDGRVKLIDFGAARFSKNEHEIYSELTKIMKTGFSPPEQYQTTTPQGAWTDIYAIGATLYYMLLKIKPVESTNRKIHDELQEPIEVDNKISERINNVIMRAMAVDIHLRFQTADEFLEAIKSEKKVLSVKEVKKERKLKRIIGISAALVLIVVSSVVFMMQFNQQRLEETLPDSSIDMWYVLPEDADSANLKRASYETIVDTFNQSFPNVEINLQAFTAEDYDVKIIEANAQNDLPNLFESSNVDTDVLTNCQDVKTAVETVDKKEVPFIKFYADAFPDYKQFPLGYTYPIKYTNQTPEAQHDLSVTGEKEMFLSGYGSEYIGSTADFFLVQESLPVLYSMELLEGEDVKGDFTDLISIGECDENQLRAVNRLLVFLLSDNAQDYLHIQYNSNSLPLNEYTFVNAYVETFDDFEIVKESLNEIEIS